MEILSAQDKVAEWPVEILMHILKGVEDEIRQKKERGSRRIESEKNISAKKIFQEYWIDNPLKVVKNLLNCVLRNK